MVPKMFEPLKFDCMVKTFFFKSLACCDPKLASFSHTDTYRQKLVTAVMMMMMIMMMMVMMRMMTMIYLLHNPIEVISV